MGEGLEFRNALFSFTGAAYAQVLSLLPLPRLAAGAVEATNMPQLPSQFGGL